MDCRLVFFLSGCSEDFTIKKKLCVPESLNLLQLCAIQRHFPCFFSEWIMVHTEGISKINPTFLFPPCWHSFFPSFHYILHFASIMGRYKAMAGSRAAQQSCRAQLFWTVFLAPLMICCVILGKLLLAYPFPQSNRDH